MSVAEDLERLYDAHAQALFAFVLGLTRDESETREVLQDVFLKLARQSELLAGAREERAFLLHLAHNASIDRVRRRETREPSYKRLACEMTSLFAPALDPDEQALRDALSEALAELPAEQRAVVHLKLWEGLTFEAIAEALGIPLFTAASRYRYALDKLRKRLRPLYEEIK
jgi:RNA polymerase sigma-70 factor (ECF subfamily)